MNKNLKYGLIGFGMTICCILSFAYYSFNQIDYVGDRDPKAVEESRKRQTSILLSAEFRNGTEYCEVDILDSVNLEIRVGNNTGGTVLNEQYELNADTIKIVGEINHPNEYFKSGQFLIHDDQLVFHSKSVNRHDSTIAMTIKFNKLKL